MDTLAVAFPRAIKMGVPVEVLKGGGGPSLPQVRHLSLRGATGERSSAGLATAEALANLTAQFPGVVSLRCALWNWDELREIGPLPPALQLADICVIARGATANMSEREEDLRSAMERMTVGRTLDDMYVRVRAGADPVSGGYRNSAITVDRSPRVMMPTSFGRRLSQMGVLPRMFGHDS